MGAILSQVNKEGEKHPICYASRSSNFLALMVGAADSTAPKEGEKDIWHDEEVLRFLQTYKYGIGLSAKERDRVYRRARAYRWMADGVMKLQPAGVMVVVPRPADRQTIATEQHQTMGHFGV